MTGWLIAAHDALRRRRRETGAASIGVLAIVLALSAVGWRHTSSDIPSAIVRRETFADTLVETGTIAADRLMLYASTIPGAPAKIAELVPEGTAVRAGDLLVRFDSSGFEQTRARERAALGQAQADLVRAREALRLQLLAHEGELAAAKQQIGFAEAGLRNQVEGRGRVDVAEAEANAAEAGRELDRARKTYEDLRPLLASGFITRAELDRAEQAWRRAEDLKRLADARRETLVGYERPAATGRAQAEVHAAREALAREAEAAAARATERRAAVGAAESRVQEITARIAMLDDQIGRTVLRAGGPGLVVYRDLFFGNDRRKPQVGDEVWSNQPIIALPDSSQLIVETRVREIDLHKVSASQRVEVRVDAYPDLRLPAAVALVGALAQEDASRASTRFFPVVVKLAAADPRLRTGMTARVQVEVRTIPSAVVVPVQAVFSHGGERRVFVARGGSWERRAVTIVAANELTAAVDGPLTPGDRVALVDPDAPAAGR